MNKSAFGTDSCGQASTLYTFTNTHGMTMALTDFGATLVSLQIPTKTGAAVDVVLGYDDAAGYARPSGTFMGATIGRCANRIGGAAFTLNGKNYALDKNNNGNNLHSGLSYYNTRLWTAADICENSITFTLHSPDGDQGFPGTADISVTYTLTEENTLRITYLATADADTIFNLTNHSYFNLNGHNSGSITGHTLWVDADSYTRADAGSIPTGEITPVAGTPMDFRTAKTVGRDIAEPYEALVYGKGYDHNWCLNNNASFAKVAEVIGENTGITMTVYTDLPGMQIYTGNFIANEPGKDGAVYQKHCGMCFETQYYPDAIHHPNFQSPVVCAGQAYKTVTEFRFH